MTLRRQDVEGAAGYTLMARNPGIIMARNSGRLFIRNVNTMHSQGPNYKLAGPYLKVMSDSNKARRIVHGLPLPHITPILSPNGLLHPKHIFSLGKLYQLTERKRVAAYGFMGYAE